VRGDLRRLDRITVMPSDSVPGLGNRVRPGGAYYFNHMRLFSIGILLSLALLQGQQARRAPSFALPDANMYIHDLQDYRGKFVLLDFMKTDCPYCVAFAQVLDQARIRYGTRIAVLSVVLPPDTMKKVTTFAEQNHLSTTFLFDCGQVAFSYFRPNGPSATLPHLYIIDCDGVIARDYTYSARDESRFTLTSGNCGTLLITRAPASARAFNGC
jgi:peroxiredoxin